MEIQNPFSKADYLVEGVVYQPDTEDYLKSIGHLMERSAVMVSPDPMPDVDVVTSDSLNRLVGSRSRDEAGRRGQPSRGHPGELPSYRVTQEDTGTLRRHLHASSACHACPLRSPPTRALHPAHGDPTACRLVTAAS